VKLWVGNVAGDADEEEIRKEFRDCGPVVSVYKKDDFCFVEFETLEVAAEAARRMNNHVMRGVPLKVQLSNDAKRQQSGIPAVRKYGEGKVRIDNLPPRTEWQEVKDLFRRVGNVLRADILAEGSMGGSHVSSSAIVIFELEQEADRAVQEMDQREFAGQHIRVTKQPSQYKGNFVGGMGDREQNRHRDYDRDRRPSDSQRRSRSRSPGRGPQQRGRSPSPGRGGRGRDLGGAGGFQDRGRDNGFHRTEDFRRPPFEDPRGAYGGVGGGGGGGLRGPPPPGFDRQAGPRYGDRGPPMDNRGYMDNRAPPRGDGRPYFERLMAP